MQEVLSAQNSTDETFEEGTEDSIDNAMETSMDSENPQGSVYSDGDDSEADDDGTEASILIDNTEVAAVNSDGSQVFQSAERSVKSYNSYSDLLRASLANSIANLRRRGIISHDVSLKDFVDGETEMIGNTSEELFNDFIRSE